MAGINPTTTIATGSPVLGTMRFLPFTLFRASAHTLRMTRGGRVQNDILGWDCFASLAMTRLAPILLSLEGRGLR